MKIVTIAGARPNFVKIAPLPQEMRPHPQFVPVLIHTGQHYDAPMSDQFLSDLEIQPPHIKLGVGSGSHAIQTAEVMQRLEPILSSLNPDLVLVVGEHPVRVEVIHLPEVNLESGISHDAWIIHDPIHDMSAQQLIE